ncbi:MAG: tetratricopeptide repeat protein [Dehalococcoidia bacterium]|nr:tetratricopeptide repeat protein [Dehalococcoidia bacterium]
MKTPSLESVGLATTPASASPVLELWIGRALEGLWLSAVLLVPLGFLGRNLGEWSSMIGSYELPKIALLRTLVGLMAILWVIEVGLRGKLSSFSLFTNGGASSVPKAWLGELRGWLRARPARWVVLAALAYLGATLLSTILSASPSVSMWGNVPGQDSYGAYTVTAYVLLFAVIATHLKTRPQLWRLMTAAVAVGVLVTGYAVAQYYRFDFLDLMEPATANRVTSAMGNPIFAAAVMLMTIPVTLIAAAITLRDPWRAAAFWGKLALWALVLAVQLLGIFGTESRGPWLGTALALAGILVLTAVFLDRRTLGRTALVLGLAGLATILLLAIPRPSVRPFAPTAAEALGTRLTAISGAPALGGIAARVELWEDSWRLVTRHPWFGFDSLSLSFLRPAIGYGPDMFRTVYLLESAPDPAQLLLPNEAAHAHNYFVHQGVEIGLLGAFASLGVFVALFVVGGTKLIHFGRGYSAVHKLLLIGLMATLAGRLLEQMVGIARVSDLTFSWVLLAAFVAMPAVFQTHQESPDWAAPASRGPRPGRSRSLRHRAERRHSWHIFVRFALVASLVAGIGTLTWAKSINYPRAAIYADQAAELYRQSDPRAAISSLDRAIDLAPDVSTYYEQSALLMWAEADAPERPSHGACNQATAGEGLKICLAEEAHSRNIKWVENRPLYFRSRLALADSALNLGLMKEDAGLVMEATRLYRESAEMVPGSWRLWNRLAEVFIRVSQPESALPPLEKSLGITGDIGYSTAALLLQGQANMALGQLDMSLEAFGRAILLEPQSPEAHFFRGSAHYQMGLEQRAIGDFDQALRLDPSFASAYNNRGLAHAKLGNSKLAIRDFDESIRFDTDSALAYNNRGFTNRDTGQPQSALDDLTRAIQLDPRFAMAYYNRALAYTMLGRDAEARQDELTAVELGFDASSVEGAINEIKRRRQAP